MPVTEIEFMFDGKAVGIFEEINPPCSTGLYRYMPFRGPGHYEMQTLRRAGNLPRCYYEANGVRVSFTVNDCPEYGVLELCDFDTTPSAERQI
jgi:hypothetical protein